jgi:geranylgeranyl pyrophosphate synthase
VRLPRAGPLAHLVQAELERLLSVVTRYQHLDAVQIERAAAGDFRIADYAESTHKAGSLIEAGLRLGLALAGGEPAGDGAERFARRFGLAFQILDDVRDLDEDRASFGAPVTLPMLCAQRGEPLDCAYELAERALAEARAIGAELGPGRRLVRLVDRLAEIVAKLRVAEGRAR